jgi:hypothetical protein
LGDAATTLGARTLRARMVADTATRIFMDRTRFLQDGTAERRADSPGLEFPEQQSKWPCTTPTRRAWRVCAPNHGIDSPQ